MTATRSFIHATLAVHGRRRPAPWLVLAAMLLLCGCRHPGPARPVERSFYYWKSTFLLKEPELEALRLLGVTRLYIRFFDVAWNTASRQPLPLAVTSFPQGQAPKFTIIPAVFITNECMEKMDTSQVVPTARQIVQLIETIALGNGLQNIPEIQLDCDWNATTRDRYFTLLKAVRTLAARSHHTLSATIRLYQYKYPAKTGVPPVDRGMLMCYNMGNLRDPQVRNSILDGTALKQYLSGQPGYPLPLDVALPLFSWKVLFRNNRYAGLVRELPASWLAGNPLVRQSGNRYRFLADVTIERYAFRAGDVLRDEAVDNEALLDAADLLGRKLPAAPLTVALYHLDSLTLAKFTLYELETVFDHLH